MNRTVGHGSKVDEEKRQEGAAETALCATKIFSRRNPSAAYSSAPLAVGDQGIELTEKRNLSRLRMPPTGGEPNPQPMTGLFCLASTQERRRRKVAQVRLRDQRIGLQRLSHPAGRAGNTGKWIAKGTGSLPVRTAQYLQLVCGVQPAPEQQLLQTDSSPPVGGEQVEERGASREAAPGRQVPGKRFME